MKFVALAAFAATAAGQDWAAWDESSWAVECTAPGQAPISIAEFGLTPETSERFVMNFDRTTQYTPAVGAADSAGDPRYLKLTPPTGNADNVAFFDDTNAQQTFSIIEAQMFSPGEFSYEATSIPGLTDGRPDLELHLKYATAGSVPDVNEVIVSIPINSASGATSYSFLQNLANTDLPGSASSDYSPRHMLTNSAAHFYRFTATELYTPCNPNVRWYVLEAPIQANEEQALALIASMSLSGINIVNYRETKCETDATTDCAATYDITYVTGTPEFHGAAAIAKPTIVSLVMLFALFSQM